MNSIFQDESKHYRWTDRSSFEEQKEAVENICQWCYSDSPGAVDSIEKYEEEPEGITRLEKGR